MHLLTKPNFYNINQKQAYMNFGFFDLALTDRNWTGQTYMDKHDCNWFLEELMEFNEQFQSLFGDIDSKTKIHFLIDLSLFTGELPSNFKLLEFLEELEDFYIVPSEDSEKIKKAIKYKKKLRHFASKTDNIPYIYRWAFSNSEHSFSGEIKEFLDKEIESIGIRDMNKFLKQTKTIFRNFVSKNPSETFHELLETEGFKKVKDDVFNFNNKRYAELVNSLFKYCFEEPSLFFYAIYASHRYFKMVYDFNRATDGMMSFNGDLPTFILLERPERNLEVFVDTPNFKTIQMYLDQQIFVDSVSRNDHINYEGLKDVQIEEEEYEKEKIDVLKTIVEWAAKRTPEGTLKEDVFTKKWVHIIEDEFFTNMKIVGMTIKESKMVMGPDGNEMKIKAVAMTNSDKPILFPLLDTSTWENLNSRQCALLAYATCLYHDLSFASNYNIVPLEDLIDNSKDQDQIEYALFLKNNSILKNGLTPAGKRVDSNKEKSDGVEGKQTEHWVSFHFRRLTQGKKASVDAKNKALKYGFTRLPEGFTFIDSFVKGEKSLEPNKTKISAVDVLSKTLDKIERYESITNN